MKSKSRTFLPCIGPMSIAASSIAIFCLTLAFGGWSPADEIASADEIKIREHLLPTYVVKVDLLSLYDYEKGSFRDNCADESEYLTWFRVPKDMGYYDSVCSRLGNPGDPVSGYWMFDEFYPATGEKTDSWQYWEVSEWTPPVALTLSNDEFTSTELSDHFEVSNLPSPAVFQGAEFINPTQVEGGIIEPDQKQ